MILIKRTNYPKSISLQQHEAENIWGLKYDRIEVRSMFDKLIKTLLPQDYSRRAKKMKLLHIKDDPSNPHYWIMNI